MTTLVMSAWEGVGSTYEFRCIPHGYKSDKGATCTPTMRGLLTGECQHHPTKPEPSADDTGFPQYLFFFSMNLESFFPAWQKKKQSY